MRGMYYVEASARRTDLGWLAQIRTQGGIVFESSIARLTLEDAVADAEDEIAYIGETGTTAFHPNRYA